MDERVFRVLEFNIIREQLANLASCEMSKQAAMTLTPSDDRVTVERTLRETDDAVALVMRKGRPPLGGNKNISLTVRRAGAGGMLSFSELLNCAGVLKAARRLLNYSSGVDNEESKENTVETMISQLGENYRLESKIYRCILSEDEMADEASFQLGDIRRKIHEKQNAIKDKLGEFIRSSKYSKAIQEGIVTMRGDRYCIPVKVEYRSEFPGLVHDMSSSGQTLFVEPAFVVDANNKIRELKALEQQEIERITMELSAEVGENGELLLNNQKLITLIDFTFAKAALALAMKAQKPLINERGIIRIINGRHPLIDKHKVVPVTIKLGEGYSTLVVTGPNTGGKTVTLKTVGLFTLMMQSGLLVPCDAGSELSVYRQVFADIGDEQSIAQSLSTFSSHMKTIVEILNKCDHRSLALFDELGAGTDPTEGAALAMAILECVHQMGASTVATTHYSELKAFTSTTNGFENACCEFSVETLEPTYKLMIGIPGKSNAFAISSRLGLDKQIVERAKEFLTGEDIRFEDMLAGIEKRRQEIDEEKLEIEKLRAEAEALRAEIKAERDRFSQQRNSIIAKAREESGKILSEAKQAADKLLSEIRRAANESSKEALKAGEAAGRELSRIKNETDEKLYSGYKKNVGGKTPDKVLPGQTVYVISLGGNASVISAEEGKDGKVCVQAGIMKMYVPMSDIRIVEEPSEKENSKKEERNPSSKSSSKNQQRANAGVGLSKAAGIKTEIDLRGMTSEEALGAVDKYIDDAVMAGLNMCYIIHGKGTGKLRSEIHGMLRHDKRIKSFRLGEYGEGDSGVTVAEFK
ncbi:MAG: endonuclease MutS2 [Clostridia bacterium]|nr:endonuclease MutS2 [Clostridia bacterium]